LKLDTRKRQYDNGTGLTDTYRPGPSWPDDISAHIQPGPLKFVNFRAGPMGRPARAGL